MILANTYVTIDKYHVHDINGIGITAAEAVIMDISAEKQSGWLLTSSISSTATGAYAITLMKKIIFIFEKV